MVSAKVSDMAGFVSVYANNSVKNNSGANDFSKVLKENSVDNTKSNMNENVNDQKKTEIYESESKTDNNNSDMNVDKSDSNDKLNKLEEEINKTKELEKVTEDVEDDYVPTVEELSKIAEMVVYVKQEIANMLNITVEKLEEQLNQLGISIDGLKQPDNMMKLIMNVNNISSPAELLVNPELSENIKDLLAEMKTIVNELPEVTEEVMDQVNMIIADEQLATTQEMVEVSEEEVNEFVKTEENVSTDESIEITGENITQKIESMSSSSDMNNMSDGTKKDNSKETAFENVMNINNVQNNGNVVEGISEAISYVTGSYSDAEVISQIIDRIKVNAKPGMSSMELQLYPEHLGKVTVQVVSKNGGITAQISAENEHVRGIIENQLVTLKDSLNNQGIKVDAVEVTVANYGFEQNMNQESEQNKEQSRRQSRVRKSLLDEVNGITKEEVMEETIMETVGNTVSFKA